MESLTRPPPQPTQQHRRKHSNAAVTMNKRPYDGVSISNKNKSKAPLFEAHEYTEIFSGGSSSSSSSIPVLDLSALDHRVAGLTSTSSNKLDYSNIFGSISNDDVALPYDQLLLSNNIKKKPPNKPPIPTDVRSPSQESDSRQTSVKTKGSSPEASSDQSVDGSKKQVNMSFNRTTQIDNETSNGKTHIAQLHAVPGFTYFVDGASRPQKTEDNRPPITSLKRGVSRTWSFSAELESGKGGSSGDKSRTPDKSLNENEVSLKPHLSDKPSTTSSPSTFASKQDASENISGESSPSFFDEILDENSVAAVSAAALKNAINQAQESIRVAKMVMHRKKQGLQDGSIPSCKGRLKVKDKKETKIEHEGYGSKEKNVWGKLERSDGKSISSLGHRDPLLNAGKAEMEWVRENVGAATEHAEAFIRENKIFAPSCSQGEILHINEKVVKEKLGANIESAEAEVGTANTEYGQVGSTNSFLSSSNKLASQIEEQAGKEILESGEVTVNNMQEPVEKLSERTLEVPKRLQELEKSVQEAVEQCHFMFKPVNIDEQGEIVDEAGEDLRIIQENEVTKERETVADDKGKAEQKFEEFKEMLNVEYMAIPRSEVDNLLNERGNLVEKEAAEQEEPAKKYETVPELEANGLRHGKSDVEEELMGQKEPQIWFHSEEQLKETLEEGISERKPVILPEVDKKQNHAYDEKEQESPEKLEQNESDERCMDVYEYEATENVVKEANNFVEAKKSDVFRDAEETNNNVSEENHNKCEFQEFAYEKDIDEAVEANNSDASTVDSERLEPCDVDLNDGAEDYQKEVKTMPGVTETLSAFGKNKVADQLFHMEGDEMPELGSLHRSASEEIFFESKLHDAFEIPSTNAKTENFGDMTADHEEKLPNEDTAEITSETHEASQEYTDKSGRQNLPQPTSSNSKTEEFDLTYLRQVLEQTSESDEGSASTTSVDNIDGLSAHESEESVENAAGKSSNEEKDKFETEMISSVSKCNYEKSEEINKSMETERAVETGSNVEKNKDVKEHVQNFDKDDPQQRIEAIKRGREREKDRIVVERAIREARERAFAEARERAERAAVERAAAEVRQRVMSEAREKLEKVNKQPTDKKASAEAKLKAERAAVERATAEARERALEKAMSQKTSAEGKTQQAERFPSSSKTNGLKHSFSSSELEKIDGSNTESAQRRKARLERHQRILERAAKALAEKNMRDHLVQKEQAERNRLSESLDADIKRWATGKEGNLRALLSTLQYILGAEGGWQPISLTEIITTAAVKKAYRKATLYVHPDKLQQRGASIQQKYICEKVFDLLKAAWNRFDSEER